MSNISKICKENNNGKVVKGFHSGKLKEIEVESLCEMIAK